MGGRKFCPQEELTREVLLQYLKGKGDIREVDGLLDITVQTMTGKSFDVVLESGSSAQIGLLKSEMHSGEECAANDWRLIHDQQHNRAPLLLQRQKLLPRGPPTTPTWAGTPQIATQFTP